jgi:hypothetical protein
MRLWQPGVASAAAGAAVFPAKGSLAAALWPHVWLCERSCEWPGERSGAEPLQQGACWGFQDQRSSVMPLRITRMAVPASTSTAPHSIMCPREANTRTTTCKTACLFPCHPSSLAILLPITRRHHQM